MKRRRILLLLALAAVMAAIFLVWPRGPKEPVYQGKRISEWLRESKHTNGVFDTRMAEKPMRAVGTNALPWLMSEFSRPISKSHDAFRRWVSRMTRGRYDFVSDEERLVLTAIGLRLLEYDMAPVLPELARYLEDPQRRGTVAWVMGAGGDLALPYFLRAIGSTNTAVVGAVAYGLATAASQTESAIPPLIQLLRHPDSQVRIHAAQSLRMVRHHPGLIVPALAGAVSDPDGVVQQEAAEALGIMGAEAKAAVPELLRLMKLNTGRISYLASNALFCIDPGARPAPRPPP